MASLLTPKSPVRREETVVQDERLRLAEMSHVLGHSITPLFERFLGHGALLLVFLEKRIPPKRSFTKFISLKKPTLVRTPFSSRPRGGEGGERKSLTRVDGDDVLRQLEWVQPRARGGVV